MALLQEWLNLFVRWAHVVAAIMWIGDSFLFMWLDSHLTKPTRPRDGDVAGELWMTHSGGFYEVIKRKSLNKSEMPEVLHWFKWESYTTWMTGFLLLIIVYHSNAAVLLVDPTVQPLAPWQAVALSVGLLPLAYGFYELLWRTPLARNQKAFGLVGLLLITCYAYGLLHVFSARAAFLQVGATLGTIMTANVFFRIIPAQRHMLAMTRAGTSVDTSYGARAKGRSIQNHYLTLPVLFTMLSNHFPSTYGHSQAWLVLALLVVTGAGAKAVMNFRRQSPRWMLAGTAAALVGLVILTRPAGATVDPAFAGAPPVSFATVSTIVQGRCAPCHATTPTNPLFAAPPLGVVFDRPEDVHRHADRIYFRAASTKTMPPGNITGITDEERLMLGAWYAQGASLTASGPAQVRVTAPVIRDPLAGDVPPAEKASAYFGTVCASCHGAQGSGDGAAAAGLNPKPRNFHDGSWQSATTDEHLRKVILEGGAAVGKSPLMPPNPALADKPEVLEAMVRHIRQLGGR